MFQTKFACYALDGKRVYDPENAKTYRRCYKCTQDRYGCDFKGELEGPFFTNPAPDVGAPAAPADTPPRSKRAKVRVPSVSPPPTRTVRTSTRPPVVAPEAESGTPSSYPVCYTTTNSASQPLVPPSALAPPRPSTSLFPRCLPGLVRPLLLALRLRETRSTLSSASSPTGRLPLAGMSALRSKLFASFVCLLPPMPPRPRPNRPRSRRRGKGNRELSEGWLFVCFARRFVFVFRCRPVRLSVACVVSSPP
jgi:hypothetical protein